MTVELALIVPRMPHPLLCPDASEGYRALADAYAEARRRIEAVNPDLIVLYSAGWTSILGHQVQADPAPAGTRRSGLPCARKHPVHAAHGRRLPRPWPKRAAPVVFICAPCPTRAFPIDTGTVTALKLPNPDNRFPASVVSCNMYADRAETVVLGKATADAMASQGRSVVAVAVTNISHRLHSAPVPPEQDRFASLKDDEWTRKLLEILDEGRLEDVSQLARTFTAQAHADFKLKGIWWLASCAGAHNRYSGEVLAYAPVQALDVRSCPSSQMRLRSPTGPDEDTLDVYRGDRNVLAPAGEVEPAASQPAPAPAPPPPPNRLGHRSPSRNGKSGCRGRNPGPLPVQFVRMPGRVGDLLYLSGVGPRQAGTGRHPWRAGSATPAVRRLEYDIEAQTRAVIDNVRRISPSGSSLDRVLDVTTFLVDMDRDFKGYNRVYAEPVGWDWSHPHHARHSSFADSNRDRAEGGGGCGTPSRQPHRCREWLSRVSTTSPGCVAADCRFFRAIRRSLAMCCCRSTTDRTSTCPPFTPRCTWGAHTDAPSHYAAGGATWEQCLAGLPRSVSWVDVPGTRGRR